MVEAGCPVHHETPSTWPCGWLAKASVAFEPVGDGRHLKFVQEEELPASVIKYFQPGNLVRKILDIYGRVRFRMHEARTYGEDEVPFEVPIL
jgi:hypothetical protein